MTGAPDEEDVTVLGAEFPGWVIVPRWVSAASVDRRQLVASRGGVSVSAPTADGLRRLIREAGG